MTKFIKNNKGLKPNHQQEDPLFEKIYFPSGTGDKLVSRVYSDGSLYYLTHRGKEEKPEEAWNLISFISEKGMSGIREKLAKCCTLRPLTPKGNAMGAVVWLFPCANQIREHIITGIPEHEDLIFQEIDFLVNTNIQTIPQD